MAHGYFKWHDLITPDLDAAAAFYYDLFGWQFLTSKRDGQPYPTILVGGRVSGGMVANAIADQPARWLSYIKVDDVDVSVNTATSRGGRVVDGPTDIDGIGRVAVCTDPNGAEFALMTPRGPKATMMLPGSFCWHELHTPDKDASFDFYAPIAGWYRIDYDIEGFGQYDEFTGEVAGLGAVEGLPGLDVAEWMITFAVDDTETSVQRAVELGATVIVPTTVLPNIGRYASLEDPQGARFALLCLPDDEPRRVLWTTP